MCAWIDQQGIMPSEINQRKTNTVSFHLYVESEKLNRVTDTEKLIVVRGLGVGGMAKR